MNVKGVRKTCAVVFGLLSIFFAVVAIHNQFFAEKAGKDCAEAAALNFDSGVESAAREQDKLIFLTVDDVPCSKALRKIIAGNYLWANIDKSANPADFEIYNRFFRRASKSENDFVCAILTPKLKPVYISTKLDEDKLKRLLPAVAKAYSSQRQKLRDRAEEASTRVTISSSGIFNKILVCGFSVQQRPFQGAIASDMPIAFLTENARLAFARYKKLNDVRLKALASSAFEALMRRYQSEKSPEGKMLIARALADASFAVPTEALTPLKEQADELVSNFQPSSASNCALALSVLVKADQIFGNPKYGQKAKDIRTKIIKCALSRYPVTANLQPYQGSNSLADAYDMALMANALCDYARANKDKAAVEAALSLISKLDADYRQNGLWSINSSRSPSAGFIRVKVLSDEERPSYVGEALQAIAKLKAITGMKKISDAEDSAKRIGGSFAQNYDGIGASIKLASFVGDKSI